MIIKVRQIKLFYDNVYLQLLLELFCFFITGTKFSSCWFPDSWAGSPAGFNGNSRSLHESIKLIYFRRGPKITTGMYRDIYFFITSIQEMLLNFVDH